MSLNPLNELKRRLADNEAPLPKRLCLARKVVQSHHFPTAPKERIVAEWLHSLAGENEMTSKELVDVIGWLNVVDDLTGELKSEFIKIIFQYLQKNPVNNADVQYILSFLENPKISTQLTQQIDEYLSIVVTLLQHLQQDMNTENHQQRARLLSNLSTYYKESKRKLEFIIKLLDGVNVETVFSFLNTECHSTVINVCQNILFPMNKKSFFVSFLQTLLRKDNIDELIAEKGDNIQSVLKIMSAFFTFPKGRTQKSPKFLADFISVFVSCFKNESQLIFAFYIMVVNSLNMDQSYIAPAMRMPAIMFEENDEKTKRGLFLQMLEILLQNEVDISVRLTDTIGEKVSKIEIKKNFTSFLQTVMMGQLKLEGKLDKTTLKIIKVALKLDPILIEEKLDQILPPIMIAKKANSSLLESYIEMVNCLLEILFKLSRGITFINQILPHVKLCLEACNTEQFELKQKLKEAFENGNDTEKLNNKIITGKDLFPEECVRMYGKCTSELLFRQNKELLVLLRKDFEEHCLMMLEEGFVSPSIITLSEVLSAILSSFLQHSKMADHTIPKQVSEEFWTSFQDFEKKCLGKFGECVLKLSYNSNLTQAFLNLCQHFAQLKLLNMKYCNIKINTEYTHTSEALDLSIILPCLNGKQWKSLSERIDDETALILDDLLILKTMTIEFLTIKSQDGNLTQNAQDTKTHLIKRLNNNQNVLIANNKVNTILFVNLDKNQQKNLVKTLIKLYLNNPDMEIFKNEGIFNNRFLLNALVLEVNKNISKCFENTEELCKAMNKSDFDLTSFVKDKNIEDYLGQISLKDDQEDVMLNCMELLKNLPVAYLEETYQLTMIYVLLFSKIHCPKKICKKIDHILQNLYELSPKYPDLYKIFSVKFLFSFKEKSLLDLMTLKIKTSNNMLPVKCLLESAVKKVKTDNKIITDIVEILLKKQKNKKGNVSCMEYFSNPVFQISCIILPIIAKEKKAITTSAYRSILANLQEKLHKSMLEAFRMIDFSTDSSLSIGNSSNSNDSMVVSENTLAILNAMGAYSLTLSKYCETTDAEELKNLDCLWSGLEFFIQNAIQAIQNPSSKVQHVDLSIQLLNIFLRHIKKLNTHPIFEKTDQIHIQIWKSVVSRLFIIYGTEDRKWTGCLEDMVVTMKFLCEMVSVDGFVGTFVKDLSSMCELKKPSEVIKSNADPSSLSSHKTAKYLLTHCLKANIVGPKCNALSKLIYQFCKALRFWIQQNYELNQEKVEKRKKGDFMEYEEDAIQHEVKIVEVDDRVCDLLRVDLNLVSEAILAGKKISLDYKSLDSIFEVQHMVNYLLGHSTTNLKCDLSWTSFLSLQEGAFLVLNSLLMAREELLEDRWPCYMQCYRALISSLCFKASTDAQRERFVDEKLAEIAHSVEKLTQSICKRKTHVSRIAAYTVADLCFLLEAYGPSRMIRQHLENSISLLLQASDSSYSVAFLRRALAGSPGHMTLTNMYTMYKRYHKYIGNA